MCVRTIEQLLTSTAFSIKSLDLINHTFRYISSAIRSATCTPHTPHYTVPLVHITHHTTHHTTQCHLFTSHTTLHTLHYNYVTSFLIQTNNSQQHWACVAANHGYQFIYTMKTTHTLANSLACLQQHNRVKHTIQHVT